MQKQDYIELFSAILADKYAAVEARVSVPDFAFDQFRAFTDLHQISGYLYQHLKGGPLQGLFPPEYLEHLREQYAMQQQRCDETLLESEKIHDRFIAAHQDVLFLKGPFVGQQFYGDMHQRLHWDIDIMVPREDVLAADLLLRELGFSRLSLVLVSNKAMTRFTHTYDYHTRFAMSDRPLYQQLLPLDLHWCLRSHFSFHLDYERIWKEQEQCRLLGRSFPVLSAEYALVMNVLGIFFDVELGIIRLKSFLDLYKMLDTVDAAMDWDAFFEKRADENILRIALNVVDLLLVVLECDNRFPRVASYIQKNRRFIRSKEPADKHRLLERSRSSMRNRVWAHALYEAPFLQTYMWTIISLPFRIAAHDRNFLRFIGRM